MKSHDENETPRAEVWGPSPVESEAPLGADGAEDFFGSIISSYSRAQAIDDGVLFDCGAVCWGVQRIIDILGFRFPVAMTASVYGAITDGCAAGTVQNKVALAACLKALKDAIKAGPDHGDTIYFTFEPMMVPGLFLKLWSRCGPGDTAEPVITIMLEGED